MDKPLVWLRGEVKTPPFGAEARVQAGFLLRRLSERREPWSAAFPANAVDWPAMP